jgi:hypothetical protein
MNSGQSLGTFLLTLHMNPFNEIQEVLTIPSNSIICTQQSILKL